MFDNFHPTVQTWFKQELGEPTKAQLEAWPAIARSEHTLLLAPTGSGKTLAAFLVAINRLMFESSCGEDIDPLDHQTRSVSEGPIPEAPSSSHPSLTRRVTSDGVSVL